MAGICDVHAAVLARHRRGHARSLARDPGIKPALQIEMESWTPTLQYTQNRGHVHIRISWFWHPHRIAIGSIKNAVSAVDHVGDVSLFESFVEPPISHRR